MASHNYHFVTHWRVTGPRETVFQILKEGNRYAEWWKPAYIKSEEIEPRKIRSLVRAKLPYTLDFTTELVRENFPHEFEIKSTGELAGRGLWKFRQDGDDTHIEFLWDVSAEKPWVRRLSFLLKPLFKWNHDWVMRVGEKALQDLMRIM